MFTSAIRRTVSRFATKATKAPRRNMSELKVRPETKPTDFEGYMRWYFVQDYQVVFLILGGYVGLVAVVKGVMALCSSPKPVIVDKVPMLKTTGDANEIPSDIDTFLTWMEADSGNLDKALATL